MGLYCVDLMYHWDAIGVVELTTAITTCTNQACLVGAGLLSTSLRPRALNTL